MDKTSEIILLLQLFQRFQQQGGESIPEFARFLHRKVKLNDIRWSETENAISQKMRNSLSDEHEHLLAEAHWRWSVFERRRKQKVKKALGPLELASTEDYSLLVYIDVTTDPTVTGASQYLHAEPSTISEAVKRLRSKGYLKMAPNKSDERSQVVSLTAKGSKALAQAHEIMKGINYEVFGQLTEEQLTALSNL